MKLTWRSLNSQINTMTEEQLLTLINAERVGAKRLTILERLHQRYSILRGARERKELMQEAGAAQYDQTEGRTPVVDVST